MLHQSFDDTLVMNRWLRRQAERLRHKRATAAAAYMAVLHSRDMRKGWRGKLKIRERMNWYLRLNALDAVEFVQRYRVDKIGFRKICDKIRPDVEPQRQQSMRGGGGAPPITTELQLSMVLRYCAGGAWQDIVDLHGVSRASFRGAIDKVRCLCRCHTHMVMV